MQLDGSVAIVTGGGYGIGRAIALALAQEGADVVVAARRVLGQTSLKLNPQVQKGIISSFLRLPLSQPMKLSIGWGC